MTHRAPVAEGGVPRIWLLPLLVFTGLIFVAAAHVLSRSIILDFVAWWPVWLLLAGVTAAARGRRIKRLRLSGVTPLLVTAGLTIFVGGHILGWEAMPSSTQRLIGPSVVSGDQAALSARTRGQLTLTSGAEFLYEVLPIRLGGDVGIPSATERTQNSTISVVLSPPANPGFHGFAGWDVSLSDSASWDLTLEGEIDADLRSLDLLGFQVFGSGIIRLGRPSGVALATTAGDFDLFVPPNAPIRVIGAAQVPSSWTTTDDGFQSPVDGEGWIISVPGGSTVTITEG